MQWGFGVLAAALAVNLIAKVAGAGMNVGTWPILTTLAASVAAWIALALAWRRMLAPFGAQQLAIVGLFVAAQFALSYAAALAFAPINALTGPYAVYLTGFFNEGLRCLLLGALIALVPRPGTFFLSAVSVFLLNSLTSGFFGLDGLVFVTVTVVLGESALAALGVTTGRSATAPAPTPCRSLVVRIALAIGLSNGLKMYLQFSLNGVLYNFFFSMSYIVSVSVFALVYGVLGAAAGVSLGFRLRRTAA